MKTKIITDDAEVRRLAKRGGIWRELRQVKQDGRPRLIIRGSRVFAGFADGYAVYVTDDPEGFAQAFAARAVEAGCDNVELWLARRDDLH